MDTYCLLVVLAAMTAIVHVDRGNYIFLIKWTEIYPDPRCIAQLSWVFFSLRNKTKNSKTQPSCAMRHRFSFWFWKVFPSQELWLIDSSLPGHVRTHIFGVLLFKNVLRLTSVALFVSWNIMLIPSYLAYYSISSTRFCRHPCVTFFVGTTPSHKNVRQFSLLVH